MSLLTSFLRLEKNDEAMDLLPLSSAYTKAEVWKEQVFSENMTQVPFLNCHQPNWP